MNNKAEGNNSTFSQAGRDIVNHGMRTEDVISVCKALIESNSKVILSEARFYAAEVAQERVEKFENRFIEKIEARTGDIRIALSEPDIQYAFLSAQRAFIRSNDEVSIELLINILFERMKIGKRNLSSVALNESIEVSNKLTSNQIDILAFIFGTRHVDFRGAFMSEIVVDLVSRIHPLMPVNFSSGHMQHMQYAGVGSITMYQSNWDWIILNKYSNIKKYGSTLQEWYAELVKYLGREPLIQLPIMTNSAWQEGLSVADIKNVESSLISNAGITEIEFDSLKNQLNNSQLQKVMEAQEINSRLISMDERMREIISLANDKNIYGFNLSSVGICIGYARLSQYYKNIGPIDYYLR